MRTIVFDIYGNYAHFRKFYAPVSPVTYPFPPPPTVMGIMGAICGYKKNEYADIIGWNDVRIAIRLLNSARKYRTGINLINTKTADRYFRPRGATPRIQIPYEFLKDAKFRIYVANASAETMDSLLIRLKRNRPVFTPSLGLAQCIADLEFVGDFTAQPCKRGEYEIVTVVPQREVDTVSFRDGGVYERLRIPVRMDKERIVHSYEEIIVEENANPIRVITQKAYFVNNEPVLFF